MKHESAKIPLVYKGIRAPYALRAWQISIIKNDQHSCADHFLFMTIEGS